MGIMSDAAVGVKRAATEEFEWLDPLLERDLPGLYDALARIRDGGKIRVGASLTIKGKDGGVLLTLSAPTEGVVGFHQGETFSAALEGLESRLQLGQMDWRKRDERGRR